MPHLSHQRKTLRSRRHRSKTIVHVHIRSTANMPIMSYRDSLNLALQMRKSDYQGNEENIQKKKLNSMKNAKDMPNSVIRIPWHQRPLSQSRQPIIKNGSSIQHSAELQSLSTTPRVIHHKAVNHANCHRIPVRYHIHFFRIIVQMKLGERCLVIEQSGNAIDHHQNVKENQKKKGCSSRLVKISVVTAIILSIVIAIILAVLLTRPKSVTTPTATLRWNKTGITVAGVVGTLGNTSNLLNTPYGATLDYQNTLYIADTYNSRIQKYSVGAVNGTTVAGNANGLSGIGLSDLNRPSQVIVASNGTLFVADTSNQRIMLWSSGSSSGTIVAGVTGTISNTNNTLSYPYNIDYDLTSNSLYLSDYTNYRVMRYIVGASSGSIVAGTGVYGKNMTQLANPVGIYFDSLSNSLIISNHFAFNIVRWPLGATSWTLLAGYINGNSGNNATSLTLATGVTLDPMGNLYVADRNNQRIQLFMNGQSEGITIAGVTGISGSNSTLFSAPWSVAFNSQLNLYVADSNNHRVQKFMRY